LAGQSADVILDKLQRYGNGETLGPQSALMWSQSAQLSDSDMENISAYVATF
jgi:cytochrome c553